MSVDAVEEFVGKSLSPNVSMFFAATRTDLTFATERDNLCYPAMRTNEGGETTVWGTAFKHFVGFMDSIFRQLVAIEIFKESPVIVSL